MSTARRMSFRQQPTDEDLVSALGDGTPDALAELYARLAPLVFGLAVRAVDAAAAEDVVQDVFLTVWRQARTFDPARGSVRAWVVTITQSRVANELRRRRRRPLDGDSPDAPIANVADDRPGPPDVAWRAFRRDAVRAALDALPPPQRKALGLAFFEEMTHEQIASVLELPLGTVKTRIRTGIQKLRGSLPQVAAVSFVALLAFSGALLGVRHHVELARDERALVLLTASDTQNLRLGATRGQQPETHARYRGRPGAPLAVVTLSSFPPAPAGRTYQAWARHRDVWTSLGTIAPGADGSARLIAERPELAVLPDAVTITVEPAGGGTAPSGTVVAEWPQP